MMPQNDYNTALVIFLHLGLTTPTPYESGINYINKLAFKSLYSFSFYPDFMEEKREGNKSLQAHTTSMRLF